MTKPGDLFDYLTTAVLAFNNEGICIYSNEASQALLIKSNRWLKGRDIETIFLANEDLIAKCGIALERAHTVVLREVDVHLPDWQRSLLIDVNITPYSNAGKIGLLLELTDRKDVSKLSHDTNSAAIFKAATRIVRGLCHEIKNPLGGIRGAAQLLALETDTDETREYTSVITHEVDRLSNLLSRMSSGAGSFEKLKTDVHESISQIAQLLSAEYADELEISFDFDTSLPRVEANIDSLEQALLNMIKNAAQWAVIGAQSGTGVARPGKAAICLKTRAAYPDPRRSLMPTRGVRIQIKDNGPGVDQAIVDQLFLPMVTRREGGTGLGLSISQEIIQSHGGFIELDERAIGAGTSFSIYLPYQSTLSQKGTAA